MLFDEMNRRQLLAPGATKPETMVDIQRLLHRHGRIEEKDIGSHKVARQEREKKKKRANTCATWKKRRKNRTKE